MYTIERISIIKILIAIILFVVIGCSKDDTTLDDNLTTKAVVDPLATENTQTLYTNLRNSAEGGVILGQQQAYLENDSQKYQSNCDISDITGSYPMLAGADLENLTNDDYAEGNWRYTRVQNMVEWVKECHKNGVVVTFSWHFREPYNGDSFYVSDMDDVTATAAFKSILEGGENHTYYKKKLVLLADFFKSLTDEDGELIPVIFRPFHEFGGAWFWWGVPYYATSEEYIQNWQFTVDYLRNDCHVHNLLYAFTPGFDSEEEYLESYPGDDYVDILGFDSYTSKKVGDESDRDVELNEIVTQLNIIASLAAERNKVAGFTEFGHDISDSTKTVENVYTSFYLDILNKIDGNIAYMMTWYNSDDKHFTPLIKDVDYIDDFKEFVGTDRIITSGDIASPFLP